MVRYVGEARFDSELITFREREDLRETAVQLNITGALYCADSAIAKATDRIVSPPVAAAQTDSSPERI